MEAPVQTQSPDMSHATEPSDESPLHEHSHIRLSVIVWFFIWFFIAMIAVEIAVYAVYRAYHHVAARAMSVPITGLQGSEVTHTVPPEPRLQPSYDHATSEVQDLASMRARDAEEFRKRGWLDEASGTVHVDDKIADQVIRMTQPGPRKVR